MAVAIIRVDHTAAQLRHEASRCDDSRAARRMLALALILDGKPRREAAESCGMDRQTLRDWIHRYNADGLAGLFDRPHGGGPARKLTDAQQEAVAGWVEAGPHPKQDGIVRWRRCDLRQLIGKTFGVTLHERSVGKLLDRLGFSHISVRPRHPKADLDAQATHKKTSPNWSPTSSPKRHAASRSNSGGRTRPGSANKAA